MAEIVGLYKLHKQVTMSARFWQLCKVRYAHIHEHKAVAKTKKRRCLDCQKEMVYRGSSSLAEFNASRFCPECKERQARVGRAAIAVVLGYS